MATLIVIVLGVVVGAGLFSVAVEFLGMFVMICVQALLFVAELVGGIFSGPGSSSSERWTNALIVFAILFIIGLFIK